MGNSHITIRDRDQPTELFNILLHHTNPINLVVLLLKILLINESIDDVVFENKHLDYVFFSKFFPM